MTISFSRIGSSSDVLRTPTARAFAPRRGSTSVIVMLDTLRTMSNRTCNVADQYQDFDALKKAEIEGTDFRIRSHDRNSKAVVIAPHGGGIDPRHAALGFMVGPQCWSGWFRWKNQGRIRKDRIFRELRVRKDHTALADWHLGTESHPLTELCYAAARACFFFGLGSGASSPIPDKTTGSRSGNSATSESCPPIALT